MVCQEYPRLVVTPALDASVEQFLAAGYAWKPLSWRIRCHRYLEPNDWYIFSAPGTEGYSAKLVNYELRGGIIYYGGRHSNAGQGHPGNLGGRQLTPERRHRGPGGHLA